MTDSPTKSAPPSDSTTKTAPKVPKVQSTEGMLAIQARLDRTGYSDKTPLDNTATPVETVYTPGVGIGQYSATGSPLNDAGLPRPLLPAIAKIFHSREESVRAYMTDRGTVEVKVVLMEKYGRTSVSKEEIVATSDCIIQAYGHLWDLRPDIDVTAFDHISMLRLLASLLARWRTAQAAKVEEAKVDEESGSTSIDVEGLSSLSDNELARTLEGKRIEAIVPIGTSGASIRTMLPPPKAAGKKKKKSKVTEKAANINQYVDQSIVYMPVQTATSLFEYRDLAFPERPEQKVERAYQFTIV